VGAFLEFLDMFSCRGYAEVHRSIFHSWQLSVFCLDPIRRGCSYAPPAPPYEAIGESPLVFLSSVLSVDGGGFKTGEDAVDQSFKGRLPTEVELFDDGMCDSPHLDVGRQYLMYTLQLPTGAIPARGCTRNRAVEYADEDLKFLKALVAGKSSTEVSGTVRYRSDEPDDSRLGDRGRTPMKDVSIMISGEGRIFRAKTGARGRYSISSIPPGKYAVKAELNGYRTNWVTDEIKLAPSGCVMADALMKVDRRAGRHRSIERRSASAGRHGGDDSHKRSSERWKDPVLLDISNEKGSMRSNGMPPGEYYVGINIRYTATKEHPYPPSHYSNTGDVSSTIPVTFSIGASVRSYDLTAPAKLRIVRVHGRITDDSGLPPQNYPQVRIKEPGLYGQIESQPVTIDPEGRFEIELCEGVRYAVFAFNGSLKNMTYSEPDRIYCCRYRTALCFE
jgi:hypothetical protein